MEDIMSKTSVGWAMQSCPVPECGYPLFLVDYDDGDYRIFCQKCRFKQDIARHHVALSFPRNQCPDCGSPIVSMTREGGSDLFKFECRSCHWRYETNERNIAKASRPEEQPKTQNPRAIRCSAASVYRYFGGKSRPSGGYLQSIKGSFIEDFWEAGPKYFVVFMKPSEDDSFREHLKAEKARGKTRKNAK
jgi:DNA-directed RNA polymerase subunit M/transcription elongation factor TFIIS